MQRHTAYRTCAHKKMHTKVTRLIGLVVLPLLACTAARAQQYTRRTNLPAIYIETFDGAAVSSKTEYVYSTLHYVDEADSVVTYDSVQIRGRGNSTWNMSKKPYRIKFASKQKFLGKGYAKAKSWTLLANAGDKTMMRNAVTSAMGRFEGVGFNPAYKFADLVLNNTYLGTYQISDQIDVRKHRVDITEQDDTLTDDSNITGGYLLEVDGFADGNCFRTYNYNVPVRIHYPDEDDIQARQTNYIAGYVRAFERRLAGSDFADPLLGYRAVVDSVTLANWYIATEVSANIDGFYSTYFYKELDDSLLYWGPLWDYDIAYDNDSRKPGTTNQLMADIGYGDAREWTVRMWDDPWFARLINRRYNELIDGGLVDFMLQTIDSIDSLMDESQQLNYQKWGINRRMYHEIVLYSSYDQYVSDLKEFVTNHTEYLRTAFESRLPQEPTPEFVPERYYYTIANAGTSTLFDAEDGMVVAYGRDDSRETQYWYFVKAGGGYQIINRSSGLAINDPTEGESTATTNILTPLNLAEPDSTDARQLWRLLPQGTGGQYNFLNLHTDHIANLRAGNAADGTQIISYSNDSRNSTSNNRLWYVTRQEPLPDDTGIAELDDEPEDYALAYSPVDGLLHFGSSDPSRLGFKVRVTTIDGMPAGSFTASEGFSMRPLPDGIYIVTWKAGGRTRSVKFRK